MNKKYTSIKDAIVKDYTVCVFNIKAIFTGNHGKFIQIIAWIWLIGNIPDGVYLLADIFIYILELFL